MNGRGAWNSAGVGGTKKYKDASRPGPYYFLGSGYAPEDGVRTPNDYVVHRAVMAYQRALRRRMKRRLKKDFMIDGLFGPQTEEAVFNFQQKNAEATGTPWGGIGPQTSEALLKPDMLRAISLSDTDVPASMVSGTIRYESNWDAGAVGYADVTDVGLAQINAGAHPEWSTEERLKPIRCFNFIIEYYEASLVAFGGSTRDAVASYNLGAGGTRSWISAGRPDTWTPAGSTTPRNVKRYIDSILEG